MSGKVTATIAIASTLVYSWMRATKHRNAVEGQWEGMIRATSFILGLPLTVVPYLAIKDGGGNLFGIKVEKRYD